MADPLRTLISILEGILPIPGLEQLFYLLVFPGFITITGILYFLILFERKVIGKVNLRYGPLHVGRYGGILQVGADLLKMLGKEIIVPERADKSMYQTMPVILVILSTAPIFLLPFGPETYVTRFEASALFVLALSGLFPIALLLTGWAPNNKYTLFGAMRAIYQTFGYELPLFLGAASVFAVSKSFDFIEIVQAQQNGWFIFTLPLGALVFFIAFMAETEVKPFDVPEGEHEIVMGPATEFTGVNYLLFMDANRTVVIIGSAVFSLLFLGGWHNPFPIAMPPYVVMLIKTVGVAFFTGFLRAIFPRVRIDQIVNVGWRYLLPLAIFNLVVSYAIGGIPL